MSNSTKINFEMFLVVSLFIIFSIWWLLINFTSFGNDYNSEIFSAVYGVLALIGGIYGISVAKKWGGFGSSLGKAIMFFSFGLLAQEFGQLVYSYYSIVRGIEVPYPSIGDIGYYGTIPLYLYAVIQLGKIVNIKFSTKHIGKSVISLLIPTIILAISYQIFLSGGNYDWSNPLITMLELVNPLGQALYISVALLVFTFSIKTLGGIMRNKILLILFALSCQYIADFVFLYMANREIWVTAGVNEYMYLFAYFVMALAIMDLDSAFNKIKKEK